MRAKATVAAALATLAITIAWRLLFLRWAPPTTFQFDLAEAVFDPWAGLSWTAVVALVAAMAFDSRLIWMPLASIGAIAVLLQVVVAVAFASGRPLDGSVSSIGAALAVLSAVQVAASVAWIGLIVRWKRSEA